MKNLNFLKLFFGTMLLMVMSTLVVGCVDDNDDTEAPYLEVSPTNLTFTTSGTPAEGSQAYFEISTNRDWTATVNDDKSWVTLSAIQGSGSTRVQVSIPAGINDEAIVAIQISNKVGPLKKEYVIIKSGDVVPALDIYHTNVGDQAVSSPYPYVDAYTGWNATGTGAASVTYSGQKATIRSSGLSNSGSYPNASGPNVIFFGTLPADFEINKIALTSEQTNLKLTFGASYSLKPEGATDYDNEFKPANFTVSLSADGTTWTPLSYTVNNGDKETPYWVFATADFTLGKAVSELYIKFTALTASAFRLDDITLATGNGGTVIDLDGGTTPPPSGDATVITIPQINAMMTSAGATIDANADRFFEAIVQNDVAGGNYSYNNLIVATEGSTAAGNGVTLYGSQVEPSTLGLTKGDRVKITLKKGLAQAKNYSGMLEITGSATEDWVTIEKLASGVAITPTVITAAQLADYQGMAVTINDATPAAAGVWANDANISTHTFNAAGTSFVVFCKKGATAFLDIPFVVSSGSITGLAAVNKNIGQLVPRDLADVTAFMSASPTITAVSPTSLTFAAAGGTQTIEVTVANQGSETLSVSGLNGILSATVAGSTVTVVATENTTDKAENQTLSIALSNGNTVTVPVIVSAPTSGNALVITANVTTADSYPTGFPDGSANKTVDEKTFSFGGYDYKLAGSTGNGYYRAKTGDTYYILIGRQGAYMELPIIAGKRLTKAVMTSRGGASGNVEVAITDTNNTPVAGGEAIKWAQDEPYTYTYNLTATSNDTAYRVYVTNAYNTQFTSWELTYE